jgi:hypothetical protein
MRHKSALSPTARLIISAVSAATTPLTTSHLCETTGSSPHTVLKTTRRLVKDGTLTIAPTEGVTSFTLTATVPTTPAFPARPLYALAEFIADEAISGRLTLEPVWGRRWRFDPEELIVGTNDHPHPYYLGWLGMERFDGKGLRASLQRIASKSWATERDLREIASIWMEHQGRPKAGAAC